MLRARLSLQSLEDRENPSGPAVIDPIGVAAPAPVAAPPSLVTTVIDAIAAGVNAVADAATPPTVTTDPLLLNNSIYKVPLLP